MIEVKTNLSLIKLNTVKYKKKLKFHNLVAAKSFLIQFLFTIFSKILFRF